jgi:hypothetical protein
MVLFYPLPIVTRAGAVFVFLLYAIQMSVTLGSGALALCVGVRHSSPKPPAPPPDGPRESSAESNAESDREGHGAIAAEEPNEVAIHLPRVELWRSPGRGKNGAK